MWTCPVRRTRRRRYSPWLRVTEGALPALQTCLTFLPWSCLQLLLSRQAYPPCDRWTADWASRTTMPRAHRGGLGVSEGTTKLCKDSRLQWLLRGRAAHIEGRAQRHCACGVMVAAYVFWTVSIVSCATPRTATYPRRVPRSQSWRKSRDARNCAMEE
jgi:hypothetical protein